MGQDINAAKRALRTACKAQRLRLSAEEKARLDKAVADKLFALSAYRNARTLLCYVSTEIEVDTRAILAHALSVGKTVAVPRCIANSREMDFYILPDLSALLRGAYGILEPAPARCEKLTDLSTGLCIVPALSYDKSGYRLGFGKGYYDRFLSRFSGQTVGLAYENCFVQSLPHDAFDRRVDVVLTEVNACILNR